MLEKNGPHQVSAADKAKRLLLSDKGSKVMNTTHQVMAAAAPYKVVVSEDMATFDIKLVLIDERQDPPARMGVRIPHEKIRGNPAEIIMRAVEEAKRRLQKHLVKNCNEPEIRLWAAENRDVDLMDNSEIPSRIRIAYDKQNAVSVERERLARQSLARSQARANERPIESDNEPVYDTPPPRARKIKRRVRMNPVDPAGALLEEAIVDGESTKEEEKPNVPVKKVVGAHSKTPIRKPRCKSRDHDEPPEMVFVQEEGVWKCPEEGCTTIARPKSEAPVGQVVLGKGKLDLRVIFTDPGQKPSILLIADNNIALDVTAYIDVDNFMKYNRVVQRAQALARDGKQIGTATNQSGEVTALIKFPEMRIYGCDDA